MISEYEDYCSFEVAKLLKEKGFPQKYDIYHSMVYNEEDYEDEYEVQRMVLQTQLVKAGRLSSYPLGVPEPKCYCPTHQMAMKWLREVHKIFIEIKMSKNTFLWGYRVTISNGRTICFHTNIFNKYEEACEAAIKYCLEHLI